MSPFTGPATAIFDDVLEPGSVGIDLEQPKNPISDKQFRERVKTADAVVRARISTVTAKKDHTGKSVYELSARVMENLWGAFPPKQDSVTLLVTSSGSSYGVVRSMEARLVGKDMLLFVKLFSVPDGEGEYHFHAMADADIVRKAVPLANSYEEK